MLTLAFGQALYQLTFVFKDITGGENGIPGILRGTVLGINLGNPVTYWYFGLFWLALGVGFLALVHASPFGHTLRVIRDDPKRAGFLGIPVFRYQLGSYVIAGAIGALAGALYALLAGIVTQDMLYWTLSGDPLIMSLIGGLRTFWGPAAGAVLFIWVQDQLARQTGAWILYQGLTFLVFVLFLPEGLASLPRRYQLWRARRQARAEAAPKRAPA
jgi:branched-chain amino acid transport system permease protein